MQVVNVDRLNSLPGCGPFDHDFCIVVSETETEPHIITGKPQRKILFRGSLKEAHAYVAMNLGAAIPALGAKNWR